MAPSVVRASSLAQASSKPAARPSLVPVASSRACFGVSEVPKTSWSCAVSIQVVASTSSGRPGSTPTRLVMMPCLWRPERRVLSATHPDVTPLFSVANGPLRTYNATCESKSVKLSSDFCSEEKFQSSGGGVAYPAGYNIHAVLRSGRRAVEPLGKGRPLTPMKPMEIVLEFNRFDYCDGVTAKPRASV